MKIKASRMIAIFLIIQLVLSVFAPVTAYANDATMLEPLIEPNTKTYKVDVVADKPSWFASGSHYEGKYINFNYYYKEICNYDFGSDDKYFVEKIAKNPTICFSLDTTINSTGASEGVDNDGYKFFLKAEGFADKDGILIADDSQKSDIINAGKGKADNPQSYGGSKNDFTKAGKKDFKVLTFPAVHGSGAKNVTSAETEYAIEVGSVLSESLNAMLTTINGGKRYASVAELVNKSILIRPTDLGYTIIDTDQETDYIIVYGTYDTWGDKYLYEASANPNISNLKNSTTAFSKESMQSFANIDDDGNLLAYIIPVKASTVKYGDILEKEVLWDEASSFVWAMPKGYAKISGVEGSLRFTNEDHSEYRFVKDEDKDVPWITIHHLSMYANNAYKNHNVDISTKTSSTDSGNWIMALIVELFMNILNGLRTVLGLSDMYTLVYNKGARASESYNYGAMSDSWWTVVLRYHLIFQSLAWFLIICGFIKVLIDLNMSTINPQKKISVLETMQRFFVVGFLLVTIIPIIQFMLTMNSSIVKIFASQVDPNASTPPVIGSLAGLILQFAYFGIVVYVNFTYIMRSVIIGILTVTAPFFIASMGFSASNKGLFTNWFKELAANIFMQSVHAFSLAFLTNLVTSGGGLESLVVSYSMIPLTELVRNLIFGGAGSHASSLGMSAASKAINAGTGIVSSAGNMIAGKVNEKLSKGEEDDGKSGSGSGSGQKGGRGGETNVTQMNNGVTNKMNGIRENLKNQAEGKGGKSISGNLKAGGASALKAAMNVGSALNGIMGMAVDMAGAEMSGTTTGYRSFGEKSTGVVRDAGKAVGNASQAAAEMGVAGEKAAVGGVKAALGAATGNTGQQGGSFSGFMTQNRDFKGNVYGSSSTNGRASVSKDPRTGATISKFSGGGQSTFSNTNDGGVTQNIDSEAVSKLADSDGADAGFYSNVQAALSGDATARTALSSMGISVGRGNGGGVKINYSRDYMKNNGIISMSASKNGKNVIMRTGQGDNVPNSFTPNYMVRPNTGGGQENGGGEQNPNPA